jgi:hypothetical protein
MIGMKKVAMVGMKRQITGAFIEAIRITLALNSIRCIKRIVNIIIGIKMINYQNIIERQQYIT